MQGMEARTGHAVHCTVEQPHALVLLASPGLNLGAKLSKPLFKALYLGIGHFGVTGNFGNVIDLVHWNSIVVTKGG